MGRNLIGSTSPYDGQNKKTAILRSIKKADLRNRKYYKERRGQMKGRMECVIWQGGREVETKGESKME